VTVETADSVDGVYWSLILLDEEPSEYLSSQSDVEALVDAYLSAVSTLHFHLKFD
jgi:hypothetical protein